MRELNHKSQVTSHESRLKLHFSRFTIHDSRFTHHVSSSAQFPPRRNSAAAQTSLPPSPAHRRCPPATSTTDRFIRNRVLEWWNWSAGILECHHHSTAPTLHH